MSIMSLNSKYIISILLSVVFLLSLPLDAKNETGFEDQFQMVVSSNPLLSFSKSALVPGWGELSQSSSSGYAFLTLEILLWAGRFYFVEEVNLREKEAYNFAVSFAGLRPGNYSKEFLHLLTRYNHSGFGPGGYNENVVRQAQSLFDDPTEQNVYIVNNAIMDDGLSWSWDSRDMRRRYSIMRKNADHNRDYVKAVTGVIVANHIISAINAARLTSRNNRLNQLSFNFKFDQKAINPILNAEFRF